MAELFRRFEGYEDLKPLLDGSDEEVLVRLGRPALVRIPGTDARPRGRFVACLLHGNEDSGYRAVCEMLRRGERYPFDLWVLIGNVRAASPGPDATANDRSGWFAHRYLDDQEDFNRVWGLGDPTTRMRRCADAVVAELEAVDLEACLDLHNNTGTNPYHAIVPDDSPAMLRLAAGCSDTVLHWRLRAHTLMEVMAPRCPAIAVECGLPGREASTEYAAETLRRFLTIASFDDVDPRPTRVFEMRYRVTVRPEVPFAFGGALTEELDLVLAPGMDAHNFAPLLAGTEVGRVEPGGALPLCVTDMDGAEVTEEFFAVDAEGALRVTRDVVPVMMTTMARQTRRDCLCYFARRRSWPVVATHR